MRVPSVVLGLSVLSLSACSEQGFVSGVDGDLPHPLQPVIRLEPEVHDFGSPVIGCGREASFRVHNDGDADLLVHDLALQRASAQLALDDGGQFPLTLGPGELATVSVSYLGLDAVDDYGELVAFSNDPVNHREVSDLRGTANSLGPIVDRFVQPSQPQSDILVVIDNSGSMWAEQYSLISNFQQFMDALVATDAAYRVAALTTDVPAFVGPVITPTTTDPVGTFDLQASVGIYGSGEERPMDMVHEVTGPGGDAAPGGSFLRDEAMLAVIVVTDEPDEYSAITPVALVDALVALKGGDPDLVRFHTIGGDVPVPACDSAENPSVPLDEVVALTGGLFESVCGNWGASLTAVAASSVVLSDRFALSEEPLLSTLVVTIDGVVATTGWTYDAASRSVVFDLGSIPRSDAIVEITYEPIPEC